MRFEALQARYGDCLLLTFDEKTNEPKRLLVDGGPSTVYRNFLKPRLDIEQAAFPAETPLRIDAVMISHIDADHIAGILDLFGELQDAEQRRARWPYRPRWLLHNSFDALAGEGEGGAARAVGSEIVLASLGSDTLGNPAVQDEVAQKVLQSYGQGSRLSTLAAALKITRNPPNQQVITFDPKTPRVLRIGDARLSVLGPMETEVQKLRKGWAKWKAEQDAKKDTASLASYIDKSVPNLSSIVVLVEEGAHTILLTGDARGDNILEALEAAKLITATKDLEVDILKLPHHGSINNADVDFFERIRAKHYVASGDGTYGNPDRATLLMLEKARPNGGYTVHLTYPAAECDVTHEEWRKGRKGPKFNLAKDGIGGIVERWKKEGKITVAEGPVSLSLTAKAAKAAKPAKSARPTGAAKPKVRKTAKTAKPKAAKARKAPKT